MYYYFHDVCVVSEGTKFSWGAHPQTSLASVRYRTLEFPPSTKKILHKSLPRVIYNVGPCVGSLLQLRVVFLLDHIHTIFPPRSLMCLR
jgi:hypothetical protein